jgi:hypothetical protein
VRAFEFLRIALSISVAALLSACSGSSLPRAGDNTTGSTGAVKNKQTFNYTGKKQTFIVPAGVKRLTVIAHGAQGAGFNEYPSTAPPGFPGRVYAIIPVKPGDELEVFVGGSGAHGGFNGGGASGASGSGSYTGNAGGGASDVRMDGDKLANRIIVAAGGGGAGESVLYYGTDAGGNGGGLRGKFGGGSGSTHSGGGGYGGTQHLGGSGGAGGVGSTSYSNYAGKRGGEGALGLGGNGGDAGRCRYAGAGGGAGGGYFGGGGGGGGGANYFFHSGCADPGQGGGGAGGSSYVEPSAIKSRMWTGWNVKGDGLVVISWN